MGQGDYVRWAPPFVEGAAPSARSALFLALNRNKRSIRIDLKQDAGRELLLALVREHDVVLESFRPGVLDRLGVGYEAMRAVNPKIVLLRDHRLRAGRAAARPRRARHELPRARRPARADRRGGRAAGAGGRRRSPTSAAARSWRRSGSSPRCARPSARGRGRSSTSRWPTARCRGWRWSRRATSPTASCRRAAELELAGGHRLLPALRVRRRRLGDARRARAEVLVGVVSRRRPRGPARASSSPRRAAPATPPSRRSSPAARAPSGWRSPPSTSAAWSRCSTSARRWRPSTSPRARWSSACTSRAPRSRSAARLAGQALAHAGGPRPAAGPGARRAQPRGAARRRLRRGRHRAARRRGRRRRPAAGDVAARNRFASDNARPGYDRVR